LLRTPPSNHCGGTSWNVVSPNVLTEGVYQPNRLSRITAVSATLHWDGSTGVITPCPNLTTGYLNNVLFAGLVPSPGNVWIAGSEQEPPAEDVLSFTSAGPNCSISVNVADSASGGSCVEKPTAHTSLGASAATPFNWLAPSPTPGWALSSGWCRRNALPKSGCCCFH
jgi:hypothetical protein